LTGWAAAATAALALALVAASCNDRNARGDPMNRNQARAIAERIQSFGETTYFDFDATQEGRVESFVADSGLRGIVVSGPSPVDLARRESVPLILVTRQSALRSTDVELEQSTTLIGVNLDGGFIRTANAFANPKSDAAPPGGMKTPEDEEELEPMGESQRKTLETQTITSSALLDATHALGILPEPATWAFTVISFDWVSNTAELHLAGEGGAPPGALTVSPDPGTPGSAKPFPLYTQTGGSPPVPPEGISFQAAAETLADELVVHASFSLPIRPVHVASEQERARAREAGYPEPVAVVPVALLVATPGVPNAPAFITNVPIYASAPPMPGTAISGYVSVDVAKALGLMLKTGQHAVYAVVDRYVTGPHIVAVR
jgi:hypothetical protein